MAKSDFPDTKFRFDPLWSLWWWWGGGGGLVVGLSNVKVHTMHDTQNRDTWAHGPENVFNHNSIATGFMQVVCVQKRVRDLGKKLPYVEYAEPPLSKIGKMEEKLQQLGVTKGGLAPQGAHDTYGRTRA